MTVESSMISDVEYDDTTELLTVTFRSGGAVWEYSPVPPEEYKAMTQADSIGKYFLSHIKGHFAARRV